MISTAIVFDHRGRVKSGEGPLEVRVTVNRHPYYIATGIKVCKQEWKFGMVIDRYDADELNRRLKVIATAVEREVTNCIELLKPIDVAEVRRKVWDIRCEADGGTPFLDWYEEQTTELHLAEGTMKHYVTTLTRLRSFNIIRRWGDVTAENIIKFNSYLHTFCICDATIHNHHKCLKAMLSRAVRMDMLPTNPYEKLKGRFPRGTKENVEYLTDEEVAAIRALNYRHGALLCTARDLFVFQLYTGLAYSDAQLFDISNYHNIDGRWVSVGSRIKTGVPFVSQLLPPAVEVLEQYGWKVPRLCNQKYNQCLKVIGEAAKIATPLHSHIARHTFATWMLRNGVKVENLARMMGHKKIEQTMRYAKVVAQSVHDDFDMIAKKLTQPTKPQL